MTNPNQRMDLEFEQDVEAAAAAWDTCQRSANCTPEDRAAFARWIAADPLHRETFERLQVMYRVFRSSKNSPVLRSVYDSVRAMRNRRRRRGKVALAAVFAVAALATALWAFAPNLLGFLHGGETYVTGVGQRSNVTLQDGSSLELNSQTTVKVSFNDKQRLVTLLDGQVLFRVAHNAKWPFVVRARDREIVALGTAFDVRLERSAMRVTLLEGKVSVTQDEDTSSAVVPEKPVVLTPGEQLVTRRVAAASLKQTMRDQTSEVVRDIDIAKVTGWRDGQVFLEDLSLGDAVAEMNKHSAVQIVLSDPSLDRLRVNGMFRAGEQEAFVTALESYFPIKAESRGDNEIALSARR
jgi:transmembrane sensor